MAGTTDVAQYTTAMKNVVSLLNPGGYFIESTEIECPFYVVGDETFKCVSLAKDDILMACKVSGVEVLQTFGEQTQINVDSDKCSDTFVVLGKKL